MAKLTVSISSDARKRIDYRAEQLGVTRSAYVEGLVAADAQTELEAFLEEGYRALAAENGRFAESVLPVAWEVVGSDDTAW
ncbi:MAG: hypothetical protein HW416_3191 [Chloroflexi bacterium]|nr:hypothetical protein [Chloroflexota bacterium]